MRSNNRFLTALLLALIALFTCGALFAQIKIMPLGDSITRGFDGSTDGAGYRNDLGALLTTEGVNFQFVGSITGDNGGNHQGLDGKTSGFILSNINTYLTASNPDVVLLHIGTNDLLTADIEDIRDNIVGIIDAIRTANPNKSITLSSHQICV